MRSTGIIRRIDDLGRIAIPKEVRRQLRIHENDCFELFIDRDDTICIKKYDPVGEKEWEKAEKLLRAVITGPFAVFDVHGMGKFGDAAIFADSFEELKVSFAHRVCPIEQNGERLAYFVHRTDCDPTQVGIAKNVLTTFLFA